MCHESLGEVEPLAQRVEKGMRGTRDEESQGVIYSCEDQLNNGKFY